jgi:hypothetical protein
MLLYPDVVVVGLDASKFDQHVGTHLLKWEHGIYEHLYPGDGALADILREQLRTRGIILCDDGIIKFRVPGSRCSGDMNTALGNCLIMTAMVITYCRQRSIACSIIDNGDDCLIITSRCN